MYTIILQAGGFALALFLLIICIYKLSASLRPGSTAARIDHSEACLVAALNAGTSNCHVWNNRLAGTDGKNRNLLLIDYNLQPAQEYLLPLSAIEEVSLTESREPVSNYLEKTGLQLRIKDGSTISFSVYDNAYDAVVDLPRLTRFTSYFSRYLGRMVSEQVEEEGGRRKEE